MQLNYKFSQPFAQVCTGIMLKYAWEPRYSLTSVSHVEQLDDDRILMYRRKEQCNTWTQGWEQIILNRAD